MHVEFKGQSQMIFLRYHPLFYFFVSLLRGGGTLSGLELTKQSKLRAPPIFVFLQYWDSKPMVSCQLFPIGSGSENLGSHAYSLPSEQPQSPVVHP